MTNFDVHVRYCSIRPRTDGRTVFGSVVERHGIDCEAEGPRNGAPGGLATVSKKRFINYGRAGKSRGAVFVSRDGEGEVQQS